MCVHIILSQSGFAFKEKEQKVPTGIGKKKGSIGTVSNACAKNGRKRPKKGKRVGRNGHDSAKEGECKKCRQHGERRNEDRKERAKAIRNDKNGSGGRRMKGRHKTRKEGRSSTLREWAALPSFPQDVRHRHA
jgi:hypothetical protein